MALDDFARRMLGLPMQMFGQSGQGAPANGSASTAALAAPMMANDEDMQRAGMQRLGQVGMLLMAAGQRMTPQQRATILAQAPQYMDGMQRDAMNAAQARLMAVQQKAAMDEIGRNDALRAELSNPASLPPNVTPQMAKWLGPEGVRKLLENQAMMNTPDAIQQRQLRDAQIKSLTGPNIGVIGQDADGNPIYGDQRTGRPLEMSPSAPAPSVSPAAPGAAIPAAPGMTAPPNANPRQFRNTVAQEAAKAAFNEQAKRSDAAKILPDILRARTAYEAGQEYIGPVQANPVYRTGEAMLPFGYSHGEDVRADIENKLARYQNPLVLQMLPPGSASEKEQEQARKGMASISDRSPAAGLASIDADLSKTLGIMGYSIPPADLSNLLRDIKANNESGVKQFTEKYQGGDAVVRMLSGAFAGEQSASPTNQSEPRVLRRIR